MQQVLDSIILDSYVLSKGVFSQTLDKMPTTLNVLFAMAWSCIWQNEFLILSGVVCYCCYSRNVEEVWLLHNILCSVPAYVNNENTYRVDDSISDALSYIF